MQVSGFHNKTRKEGKWMLQMVDSTTQTRTEQGTSKIDVRKQATDVENMHEALIEFSNWIPLFEDRLS